MRKNRSQDDSDISLDSTPPSSFDENQQLNDSFTSDSDASLSEDIDQRDSIDDLEFSSPEALARI